MTGDRDGYRSNPYRPNEQHGCCEACVFGRGEHAPWCYPITDELLEDLGRVPEGLEVAGRSERLRITYFRRKTDSLN
jgi:hypothetical protein